MTALPAKLKTLSKKDPQFQSYLLGTFSNSERALPLTSLNVNSGAEEIIFQIVSISEVKRPAFIKLWAEVFRARNFIFVLFPLYLVLTKNLFDDVQIDPELAVLSAFTALFLTLGAFLLSDFLDHMKGIDRIHPLAGSQAIQKGWVTASATRTWAVAYLIFGVLLGLPALWVFPELLWFIIAPALVAFVVWISPRIGLKYKKGAEWVVFLLFGPLLTTGYQIAIGGDFDLEVVAIGILTGWSFVFLVHLKNFRSLLVNSQAGFSNTVSVLGFERGRIFLEVWWWFFVLMLGAYNWIYHAPEWFLAMSLFPLIFSAPFLLQLRRLKSSVGSQNERVFELGKKALLLTLVLWTMQTLFYLLVIETTSAGPS